MYPQTVSFTTSTQPNALGLAKSPFSVYNNEYIFYLVLRVEGGLGL